ncbi:MAG: GNAT family N-acetyltransferase [Oscillospiraceae bacterium]|nr:GNAT family N-acetyltransferase [Oscillospiraceae bacterium]
MNYILEKVKKQDEEILFRLLQYSLFEESATDLNEMNDKALFEYEWFDLYFTDDDRDAYFIKSVDDNKLLGFVMVNGYMQKCGSGHSIAEFMVIPKYRRNKIGRQVAFDIFDKYSGNWEVSPSYNSETAYNFWDKTISEYTEDNYTFKNGIFTFKNKEQ